MDRKLLLPLEVGNFSSGPTFARWPWLCTSRETWASQSLRANRMAEAELRPTWWRHAEEGMAGSWAISGLCPLGAGIGSSILFHTQGSVPPNWVDPLTTRAGRQIPIQQESQPVGGGRWGCWGSRPVPRSSRSGTKSCLFTAIEATNDSINQYDPLSPNSLASHLVGGNPIPEYVRERWKEKCLRRPCPSITGNSQWPLPLAKCPSVSGARSR